MGQAGQFVGGFGVAEIDQGGVGGLEAKGQGGVDVGGGGGAEADGSQGELVAGGQPGERDVGVPGTSQWSKAPCRALSTGCRSGWAQMVRLAARMAGS